MPLTARRGPEAKQHCRPSVRRPSRSVIRQTEPQVPRYFPWRASGPGPCMPGARAGPAVRGLSALGSAHVHSPCLETQAPSLPALWPGRRPPQSAGCMLTRMPRRTGWGWGCPRRGGQRDGLARARSRPSIEQARPGPARHGFNILSEPPYLKRENGRGAMHEERSSRPTSCPGSLPCASPPFPSARARHPSPALCTHPCA